MKRKILLSPLLIIVFIIVFGVTAAGAAILLGGGTQGETNTQSINLQKGLIGWWKFDGNAKDATLYANNGTVTGAVLANDRKGQAQKAYGFNGSSKIDLGDVTILNGATTASWSFWFKLNSVTAERAIIARELSTDPTRQFSVTISTSRELRFSAAGALLTYSGTNTMPLSTWTHVVVTYDGTQAAADRIKYYSNGSSLSYTILNTVPTSLQTMTGVNLFIGHREANSLYFDGDLDDVRMYNRALSATEITALYQEYNPGIQVSDLQKGLVGNWDMNGNAKDKTLYANNGTVSGAVLTTDRKGQTDKAYDFDGTNDIIQTADGISVFNIASELTYSAWFYVDTGNSGWQRPFQKFQDLSGGNVPYYGISYGNVANTFMCEFTDSDTAEYAQYSASVSSPSGSWYHVVCVASQSAGGFDIYVNGVDKGGVNWFTSGTINTGNRPITIGGARAAGTYWNGKIDDVRIYNRALSATEITALYQEYNPGIQVSDLQKGLVGNWDMNGNAKDKTLYANNGTVTGATLTTDRKGQVDKAYSFDAASSKYINAGSGSSLGITGNITVSAWANFSISQTNRPLVAKWGTDQAYVLTIPVGSNDKINFSIRVSEVNKGATSSQTYNDGNWHHYVGVFNGVNVLLYVDGGAEAIVGDATTGPIDNPASNPLVIGNYNSLPSGNQFSGSIDDVRIYNRALTATEVLALYESY